MLLDKDSRNMGTELGKLTRTLLSLLSVFAGLMLVQPIEAQIDVLTQRYDNSRSGVNLKETKLKKSNVNKNTFGKLAFRNVDGNIYAQPLLVFQARIVNRPAPVNVAIIATEHNSVYAFDADDPSPDPPGRESQKALWQRGPKTSPDGSHGL